MKTRTVGLTLALTVMTGVLCWAGPEMGTWKLNEKKSKFAAGATKNQKVVYEAAKEMVKVTVDGTDAAGKAAHNEWTGKFDGKDYPVTGDPNFDSRSYTKVDDRTLEMAMKKEGKVVVTGKLTISADGKSRTVTTSGTNAKGEKSESTAVYAKE